MSLQGWVYHIKLKKKSQRKQKPNQFVKQYTLVSQTTLSTSCCHQQTKLRSGETEHMQRT